MVDLTFLPLCELLHHAFQYSPQFHHNQQHTDVSEENPSDSLVILANFIVKVYARCWFGIRAKPSCIEAPKHLYNMIVYSRFLQNKLRKIVYDTIQRNAFYAHVENILLSMMCDDRDHIRELALRRIFSTCA